MKKHSNIPIFIPHLGCKNDCVFCNQRSITGQLSETTVKEVKDTIDRYLTYLKNRDADIAFFGGSFTGLQIEKQTEYLKTAFPYLQSGKVSGIRLSTRPDYINEEILQNLKNYGVKTIELGVQSMCDDVLLASKRGHLSAATEKSCRLIKSFGFSLGLQMMVGLPEDTREKSIYTARRLIELGAEFVRIYPTCVLYDTVLYSMYNQGTYTPLSIPEAVETSYELTKLFKEHNIPVIRTGLQSTDTLPDSVAAGPYHPAFGELVASRFLRDELEKSVLNSPDKNITFYCPENMISKYTGQKRCNIDYLEQKYNIRLHIKPLK